MQELASFVMTLDSWFVIDDSYFLSSFILAAFLKPSDFVWGVKKIGSPPNLLNCREPSLKDSLSNLK